MKFNHSLKWILSAVTAMSLGLATPVTVFAESKATTPIADTGAIPEKGYVPLTEENSTVTYHLAGDALGTNKEGLDYFAYQADIYSHQYALMYLNSSSTPEDEKIDVDITYSIKNMTKEELDFANSNTTQPAIFPEYFPDGYAYQKLVYLQVDIDAKGLKHQQYPIDKYYAGDLMIAPISVADLEHDENTDYRFFPTMILNVGSGMDMMPGVHKLDDDTLMMAISQSAVPTPENPMMAYKPNVIRSNVKMGPVQVSANKTLPKGLLNEDAQKNLHSKLVDIAEHIKNIEKAEKVNLNADFEYVDLDSLTDEEKAEMEKIFASYPDQKLHKVMKVTFVADITKNGKTESVTIDNFDKYNYERILFPANFEAKKFVGIHPILNQTPSTYSVNNEQSLSNVNMEIANSGLYAITLSDTTDVTFQMENKTVVQKVKFGEKVKEPKWTDDSKILVEWIDGKQKAFDFSKPVTTSNLKLFPRTIQVVPNYIEPMPDPQPEPQPETPTERNIKISFVTEDKTNVGDAEVTLPVENGTTAKLSDLVAYVPEGYELVTLGDLYIDPKADTVEVTVRKKAVVEPELPAKREVNVEFVTEDNKVVGNKKLTLSVENGTTAKLSDLEVYVPEGYELAQSGDLYIAFDADSVQVSVRKKAEEKPEAPQLPTTVDVTIQFLEDGKNIVSEQKVTLPVENGTIAHYADVEKYVPEGFELSQSGDFYVDYKNPNAPVKIEVRRKAVTPEEPEQPQVPVTVDVELHFVEDGKDVVAKEKVTLPVENGTVAHYADVEKYVPAGYELCNAGDFYVDYKNPNEPVIIAVRRIPVTPEEPQKPEPQPEPQPEPEQPQVPTTVDVVLHFVDGEEIISKEKVTLPVQYGTVAKYADVEKYVPAGYELAQSGDFFVDPAEPNAPIEIQVRKVETEGPTEPQKPETPENKPEAPQKPEAPENKPEKPSAPSDDKKPAAKPEKHEGVNTGDFASLFAGISAVTAGSAAAVLAMRKKRHSK